MTCKYESGYGIGKREYRVGKIDSPRECSLRCIRMKKKRPDINGVIYVQPYRVCYCVGGMQGRRKNTIWKSCFLEEKESGPVKTSQLTYLARGAYFMILNVTESTNKQNNLGSGEIRYKSALPHESFI